MMSHNRKLSDLYSKRLGYYRLQSPILNPKAHSVSETTIQMSDKRGLQALLLELAGRDEDGMFENHNRAQIKSKLKLAEEAVASIEEEFENLKTQAANEGRVVPKEMPTDMLERYHIACARLDVIREEQDKLKKLLKEIEDKEQKIDDGKVLVRGADGCGLLRGGILTVIDGQKVSPNEDGVLIIDDTRSPYNKMRVCDYREFVVTPWKQAQDRRINDAYERSRSENIPVGDVLVGLAPLPSWPENVPRPDEEQSKKKRNKKAKIDSKR